MSKQSYELSVVRAVLEMGDSQIRLTVNVARQFPIHLHRRREQIRHDIIISPQPMCKVMHRVLDRRTDSQDWLYLVDEPEFGMYWTLPNVYDDGGEYDQQMRERGELVDTPHKVPTVVL